MKITSFPINRPVCLLFELNFNTHSILISVCCITALSHFCPDSVLLSAAGHGDALLRAA